MSAPGDAPPAPGTVSPHAYLGTLLATVKRKRPTISCLRRQPPRLVCEDLVQPAAGQPAAPSGAGTFDISLRLSHRVLTHLRHTFWGTPLAAAPIDPIGGRQARALRALLSPRIVYYDGGAPTEFSADSPTGEADVSQPGACARGAGWWAGASERG